MEDSTIPQQPAPAEQPAQNPVAVAELKSAPPPALKPTLWARAIALLLALSIMAAVIVVMRGGGPPDKRAAGRLEEDAAAVSSLISSKKAGIAWIHVRGAITESDSSSPFERGAQQTARRIREMAAKKEVRAIVLDINSPGGSVGAVQAIYAEILRARSERKKPVIAVMRDVAASGGYYLAAGCDRIVAQPGTLTGSIGVIFSVPNLEGLMQKIGVRMDPIKSGKFKDIGSSFRAMSPEEKKILQDVIGDAYSQFLEAVKKGRKLSDGELKDLADGRIFTGSQALKARLVDKLGGDEEAIQYARELGGLERHPKIFRETEPLERLFSLLDSRLGLSAPGALAAVKRLDEMAAPHLSYLWTLQP